MNIDEFIVLAEQMGADQLLDMSTIASPAPVILATGPLDAIEQHTVNQGTRHAVDSRYMDTELLSCHQLTAFSIPPASSDAPLYQALLSGLGPDPDSNLGAGTYPWCIAHRMI